MNILIISRLFAPQNMIGAVRPTQLAINLASLGHQVTCITERIDGQLVNDENISPVTIVRISTGLIGRVNTKRETSPHTSQTNNVEKTTRVSLTKNESGSSRLIKSIRKRLYVLIHTIDEYEWSREAYKKARELLKYNQYDIVFTSFGPIATVLTGLRIKTKFPKIHWISDMRDPMTNDSQGYFRRKANEVREKRMVKKADAIVTISDALGKKYRKMRKVARQNDSDVYVIENGYDNSTIPEIPSFSDGILRIGYTGTMYGGMRRMDSLFKAIKELEVECGEKLPVEVHYAGAESQEIIKQAQNNNAIEYVVNHGSLSRKDAIALQQKCDILCVLSWNTKNEQGVLTGKFPEYLKLRKPVLAIIEGDVPGAELSDRIEKLRIGFSYECILSEEKFDQFKKWIGLCVDKKRNGMPVIENINESEIKEYSYPRLAARIEKVFQRYL